MDITFLLFFLMTSAAESQHSIELPNCGQSDVIPDGDRIVGGSAASIEEYPWQVSLHYKRLFLSPAHLCGAIILNEKWIITAAHCVDRRIARNFKVVVGITSQKERSAASYSVERIKVHELFDPRTFLHDIAVIRVSSPISIGRSGVNGVCLPPLEQNVTGYATASGWGAVREDGGMTNILQTAVVPLLPSSKCTQLFGPEMYFPSSMLCAGYLHRRIDACAGDSGGPLTQLQNGRAVLIGIVSWGIGCARPNLPGVYTRVSHYIDWILKHVT